MYFRELCSTLFLLAVPVLIPLYLVHLSQWGRKRHHWQRCMDLLVMALLLCQLILGRFVGLAEAFPDLPLSLLSSSAGWVQHVPADLYPAPGHSAPQLGARWSHDLIPPINCINTFPPTNCIKTFPPTKGRMKTMCFLHWRIEKEAVSESLIIFANKIRRRVWLSLLSKCYLPLTGENELC